MEVLLLSVSLLFNLLIIVVKQEFNIEAVRDFPDRGGPVIRINAMFGRIAR